MRRSASSRNARTSAGSGTVAVWRFSSRSEMTASFHRAMAGRPASADGPPEILFVVRFLFAVFRFAERAKAAHATLEHLFQFLPLFLSQERLQFFHLAVLNLPHCVAERVDCWRAALVSDVFHHLAHLFLVCCSDFLDLVLLLVGQVEFAHDRFQEPRRAGEAEPAAPAR